MPRDKPFQELFDSCGQQKKCQHPCFYCQGRELEPAMTPKDLDCAASTFLLEMETKLDRVRDKFLKKVFFLVEYDGATCLDSMSQDQKTVTATSWNQWFQKVVPKYAELGTSLFKDIFGVEETGSVGLAIAKMTTLAADPADQSRPAKGVSHCGSPLATPATAVPDNIDDGKEDQEDNEAGDIEIPGDSDMIDKVLSILDETSCPSGKRAKSHVPRLSGKQPSNYKSDGRVAREIRYLQQGQSPHFLIPRRAFGRVVRDYLQQPGTVGSDVAEKFQMQQNALDALQCGCEALLVDMFADLNLLSVHDRGRITVMLKDLQLRNRIKHGM
jgi:histone H3/H4